MINIQIKPLSVNHAYRGRRFKTPEYKSYEKELSFLLPKMTVPKGKLQVYYRFGFSNKRSDVDNPVKVFTDILQATYGFNDKQIYKMVVEKIDVEKGDEFITFDIKNYA